MGGGIDERSDDKITREDENSLNVYDVDMHDHDKDSIAT